MDLLSVLLLCKDPAAKDLIAIMGECSSAKEVVMAAQEEMEKLIDRVEENEDDDDQEGEENERSGGVGPVVTFIELIGLYRAGKVGLSLYNLINGYADYNLPYAAQPFRGSGQGSERHRKHSNHYFLIYNGRWRQFPFASSLMKERR